MASCTYTPSSNGKHYLNLNEAVVLGYGAYQTLRRYISDGRLPAVKIGGRVKVLRSDLDALAKPAREADSDKVESAVERIVSAAPPLTTEQRERLAVILGGAS